MKNRVVRNFIMFMFFWFVITLGLNIFNKRPLFTNFPWEVLLLFLLALIPLVSNLKRRVIFGIDFVVFFIFMMITGGYYNWTSLIVFAAMSVFMTVITFFIGYEFKRGEKTK